MILTFYKFQWNKQFEAKLVTPATHLCLHLFKSCLLATYIFLCHKICYSFHTVAVLALGSTLGECQRPKHNINQRNVTDPTYLKTASVFPSFPTQMSWRCISQGECWWWMIHSARTVLPPKHLLGWGKSHSLFPRSVPDSGRCKEPR